MIRNMLFALCLGGALPGAQAQELTVFAVEVKTGPAWDAAKAPAEQAYFRDHSATMKRLRDEGRIVMGARYADKGLLVMRGANAEELKALLGADPAIQHGTFVFDVYPMNVFYPGQVAAPVRAATTK